MRLQEGLTGGRSTDTTPAATHAGRPEPRHGESRTPLPSFAWRRLCRSDASSKSWSGSSTVRPPRFGRPFPTVLLELNSRQVMFALSKIHGMLACERRLEATRDTKFVERRRRA